MLDLPSDWTETPLPDVPARSTYDSGYEYSLEHLFAVPALVEDAAAENGVAAGAA